LGKWNVENGFNVQRESKNKTKKLLTCNRCAKILEKRKTLNSKPQKLGKMELGNEFWKLKQIKK
jgi:hypothetical protein